MAEDKQEKRDKPKATDQNPPQNREPSSEASGDQPSSPAEQAQPREPSSRGDGGRAPSPAIQESGEQRDFWSRVRGAIDKSLEVSRDVFTKARERTTELGERGVLRFELSQLEQQAEQLVAKLGEQTRRLLVDEAKSSVTRRNPAVRDILDEIERVEARIDEKREQLKQHGEGNGSEASSGDSPEKT
jgi:hypothetical protein